MNSSMVSIHALLAECDPPPGGGSPYPCCFNPRTPCGVRRDRAGASLSAAQFQSTHSLRSATLLVAVSSASCMVSIHALLAECDPRINGLPAFDVGFNPRTPCGVRLWRRSAQVGGRTVSIHALLAECDKHWTLEQASPQGFNPRTPCGVRLFPPPCGLSRKEVSIHALLAECDPRHCGRSHRG